MNSPSIHDNKAFSIKSVVVGEKPLRRLSSQAGGENSYEFTKSAKPARFFNLK